MSKLQEIKEILKEEYDGRMTDTEIDTFAKQLNYSMFVGKHELSDIFSTIYENECEAGIMDSSDCNLFCQLIELLDSSEDTAKRLYECFMNCYDFINLFLKLYAENDEYLTEEQLSKVKKKALNTFDKEILKLYGVTE